MWTKIAIGVAVVLAALCGVVALQPDTYNVTRTAEIAASRLYYRRRSGIAATATTA